MFGGNLDFWFFIRSIKCNGKKKFYLVNVLCFKDDDIFSIF